MRLVALTVLLVGLAVASKVRYDNFTVYELTPTNEGQVQALRDLEEHNNAYNFWSEVRSVNLPVHIMVPPHMTYDFQDFVQFWQINHKVMIENVQERIEKESPRSQGAETRAFGFTDYYRTDEIYTWLDQLAAQNPNVVSVISAGMSYEGREIRGVRVSFSAANENNAVFLEGGIHAREWISVATTCYLLNEILSSNDPAVRSMAERYDWYIFPVFNPDGYEFTHTTNRMWRKTRVPYGSCYGADPNRNWAYRWNTGGASSNPCSETYAGPYPFSEPSTASMSEYLSGLQSKLVAYIGFHSFSQLLLYPYGHTTANLDNYEELNSVGLAAAESLAQRYGTRYTVGNIAATIYVATGSSMDWMAGNYGTRISYTYELRDLGQFGFLLPADQIIPTGEETLDSIVTIMDRFNEL